MSFYGVKTKVDNEGRPRSLGYRYPNGSYKVRDLSAKDFRALEASDGKSINEAGLFGRDKFSAGSHKYVTITEGELDAISLHQVLRGSPVVSVQSSGSALRDCSLDRSWLQSFERIYLAFDGDTAGREACHRVAKLFDHNRIQLYQVKFTKRKDANEYLVAGEEDELRNIWTNAQKYLPENIVSSWADFDALLNKPKKPSVPYPFPTLNAMTYGIRTGESVLITALPGVGKTELMRTLEAHILRETDDAVGSIFLEEPQDRHLQALAGIQLEKPCHLPDSGVSNAEVSAALRKITKVDGRLHVYNHFGSNDPEELADIIRYLVAACGCRYILLDHISMAVSGLHGDNIRRALDYLTTKLEMMLVELDFALIFVSHVNDYGETRDSRGIGQIANIRIDLTRDVKLGELITHVMVSKNRFASKTGPAGRLTFDPIKYILKEEPSEQLLFDLGTEANSIPLVPGQGEEEEVKVPDKVG